jgi:uncharacterized protein YraI
MVATAPTEPVPMRPVVQAMASMPPAEKFGGQKRRPYSSSRGPSIDRSNGIGTGRRPPRSQGTKHKETLESSDMRHVLTGLFALLLALIALPAAAQYAVVTAWVNMRAGPGTQYPIIAVIPRGEEVRVFGCVRGYAWCDVQWRRDRGWVYARYLSRSFAGSWRPLPQWGAGIGLPIIPFIYEDYLDRHYWDRPFYHDLKRWPHDRDRDHKRHRDRDKKWHGKRDRDKDWDRDKDRDRDRDRDKRWDRDKDRDRDWDDDRDRDRDRDHDRHHGWGGDDDWDDREGDRGGGRDWHKDRDDD